MKIFVTIKQYCNIKRCFNQSTSISTQREPTLSSMHHVHTVLAPTKDIHRVLQKVLREHLALNRTNGQSMHHGHILASAKTFKQIYTFNNSF